MKITKKASSSGGFSTPIAVTSGGTGTATAFTTGSVVFADGSGVYAQRNSKFFWDDTNFYLGIGTASPDSPIKTVVTRTDTTNFASADAINNSMTINPASSSGSYFSGIENTISMGGSQALTGRIYGVSNSVTFNSSASSSGSVGGGLNNVTIGAATTGLTNAYGLNNSIGFSGVGTQTLMSAEFLNPVNSSSGTITTMRGASISMQNASTGTVGTAQGVYVKLTQNNASGTVSNNYGVYIDTPFNSGTITNNYGLYVADTTAINYMNYQLGLGTNNPSAKLGIAAGTDTTGVPIINATQTWNNAGVTFTAAKINVTNTASNVASALLDLQVGGASAFKIIPSGSSLFKPITDSTTAFSMQNNAGTEVFGFDSTNRNINMGGGTFQVSTNTGGIALFNTGLFGWNSSGTATASSIDTALTRKAAANIQLGKTDAASPVAQTLSVQSVIAGTSNTAGAAFTINGSQGTGTGAGGSIIFKTAPAHGSDTVQGTLTTALTIPSTGILAAAIGLTSPYHSTSTANPAAAGVVRLANTEGISWRNAANNADVAFTLDGANTFNAGGGITPTTTRTYALGGTSNIWNGTYTSTANLCGSTSGNIALKSIAAVTTHNLIFPNQGSNNSVLRNDGSGNLAWPIDSIYSQKMTNYSIVCTVAASALTIALKDSAAADCTATTAAEFAFRSATAATGTKSLVSVTGALSTVISSGSTAGHASGVAQYIWVYLLNNAGTAELAWSSSQWDEGSVQTTTAEGGAGAADSNRVLYSTTARTGVAIRLIGRLLSSQATAGTWASTMTEIALPPFNETHAISYYTGGGPTGTISAAFNLITYGTKQKDNYNGMSSGIYTVAESGIYSITASAVITATWSGTNYYLISIFIDDGRTFDKSIYPPTLAGLSVANSVSAITHLNAGQNIRIKTNCDATGSPAYTSNGFDNYFSITRIGSF